ncbi:hypothetical protein [Phyllobacterium myrsinacearum]|uniref:hypothetical protein n=1 Tax=Phyllobacterium myrsinacearum TaxID=28101 RepID=UPI001028E445|nr:hypothetical protein [Phyllobacterium myrsinacearum]
MNDRRQFPRELPVLFCGERCCTGFSQLHKISADTVQSVSAGFCLDGPVLFAGKLSCAVFARAGGAAIKYPLKVARKLLWVVYPQVMAHDWAQHPQKRISTHTYL